MCDWVAQNINRMRPDLENGDVYGLVEDDWAYIIGTTFNRAAEDGGYNAKALLSYMAGAGLIRTSGRRPTMAKRIHGTVVKCVCLKLTNSDNESTDNLCEIDLLP